MAQQVTLFNSDPNIQAQAALIQQRQAMAQALLKEGMTPLDTKNRMMGNVAYHISPFEGLAKLLQTETGQQGIEDTTKQQAQLAAQAYGNLLNKYQPGQDASYSPDQVSGASTQALGDGATQGSVGPTNANAVRMGQLLSGQQPANPARANPNNPQGIPAQILAQHDAGMIGDEQFKALTAAYAPTDATKAAVQGGMPIAQANQTAFAKGNTIAARPQQSLYTMGPNGLTLNAVAADPTSNLQFQTGPGNTVSAQPVAGSVPNKSAMTGGTAYAQSRGSALGGYRDVTMSDGSVVPMLGDQIPQFGRSAPPSPGQPAAVTPQSGVNGNFQGDPAQVMAAILGIKDPQERANAIAAFNEQAKRTPGFAQGAPLQIGQSTAARAGAQNAQDELSSAWKAQQSAHQTAQSNQALLDNMRSLADSAITGYEPDRRTYLQKLGAWAGIKGMDDTASSSDLLNKYSAQLIAGLAQKGGMGTDAARDLVMAGTPNSHMQATAIKEAIDGLRAREQVTQARTAALQPYARNRDAANYQQAASAFDSNADPRIWQWRAIQDPKARAAFAAKLAQSDPSIPGKIKTLESMGVLR